MPGPVNNAPGGGGATIPNTTNLIEGDGFGNGADSGRSVASIPTVAQTNNILVGDNAGNAADSGIASTVIVTCAAAGAPPNMLASFTGAGPNSLAVQSTGIDVTAIPAGPLTLSSLYAAQTITPVADGTYTPVTSITVVNGIITAIS